MRKLICLLAILLLTVSVAAKSPSVVDGEGLLNNTETETLENSFSQYHKEFAFTVAAVTAEDFGGLTAEEYAKKCYSEGGYDNDGILLLVSRTQGQWYIYTSGICTEVISDNLAAQLGAKLSEDMADGKYYNAFKTFAKKCTVPICERLNTDDVNAGAERSANKVDVVLGLTGGLITGVLAAFSLGLATRRVKPGKGRGVHTSNDPM